MKKMDRALFVEQMEGANPMDREQINKILVDSVNSNIKDGNLRGHRNLIIVMEELSELAKEISKELRGKGDSISILEELADVQLGIYYVQVIVGIQDESLLKAMAVKMKRLASVLYDVGQYQ